MCVAYARQQIPTRSFVNALKENDLLVSRNVDLKMPKGERIEVRGFKVIDDKKLRELPSEVVSEWWPKGWGAAAYAQIVSMGNFGRLLYRARRADD